MGNKRRGMLITDLEMDRSNSKGFLPQIVKSKDITSYFIGNYVDKEYIDGRFRDDFLVRNMYKVEVSYYIVYRISWDANVRWTSSYKTSETIGDFVLETTHVTRHSYDTTSGTTVCPDSTWDDALKVTNFDDDDVCGLGSVDGLGLRFFSVESEEGDYVMPPMTQEQIGKKALKTAKHQEGRGKSVSITWSDLAVLVPIVSVYNVQTNKSVFLMNLYNKACGLDDVPLRSDLATRLTVFARIGFAMKWVMFAGWVYGQIIYTFLGNKFHWWVPFVWVATLFALILFIAFSGGRADIRKRIIKNPRSCNFFRVMLLPLILMVVSVVVFMAVSGLFPRAS